VGDLRTGCILTPNAQSPRSIRQPDGVRDDVLARARLAYMRSRRTHSTRRSATSSPSA